MDFTSRYPVDHITVLAQDPSVCKKNGEALTIKVPVPSENLAPGPKSHRIEVIDFDATEDRYYAPYPIKANGTDKHKQADRYAGETNIDRLVADRDFHAQNVYGHVATTLAQFESALGRHVNWTFDSRAHHIKVAPHAFLDANAFYSRRDEALCFGYFANNVPARRPRDYVYTCLSADIVTHETSHAILDGLRRELMRPSTPDQPAFHEGFADCVALLSALSREELLKLVLPTTKRVGGRDFVALTELTPKALSKSVLIGLAEQFGTSLADQSLMDRSATALRRSVKMDPAKENYDTLKDAEAHELGEILVAAALNAFLEIWYARSQTLLSAGAREVDRDRAIEDGARAAQDLLHMMIRAIDYIPPVHMTYRDFLTALLTVDRELTPGPGTLHYRKHILDSFARYKITPSTASSCWDPPQLAKGKELEYGFSGYAEMTWDREAIMRFMWENRTALEVREEALTSVNFVRPSVRTGTDGFLLRETIVEYFQLIDVTGGDLAAFKLKKPNTMPDDAAVRLIGGATLVFDDYGRLKYNIGSGVLSKKQNDRVAAVWEMGEGIALRRFESLHLGRMLGGGRHSKEEW